MRKITIPVFSCVGRLLLLALSKVRELSSTGNSVSMGGGLSLLCWLLLVVVGGGLGDSVLLTRVVEVPMVPIDSRDPGRKVEYLKINFK